MLTNKPKPKAFQSPIATTPKHSREAEVHSEEDLSKASHTKKPFHCIITCISANLIISSYLNLSEEANYSTVRMVQ